MKFKRIAAALAACAILLASAPALAASYHTQVRVLLSTGKNTSLEFTPVGDFYIAEAEKLTVPNDALTISATGARVALTVGGQTVSAASLTLVNRDYGDTTSYIRLKNSEHGTCTYLGNITFDVANGRIRAINTLPIEQYLYGVVPNEMSNGFPVSALKAQAVCARSYVMAKCSVYSGRSYDIGDTSSDQVYAGYASRNARAIAAVDETAGVVLTYEGEIIEAFYSSSNGGQTERTSNVWSEDHAYYVNEDDPYDLMNPSSLEYVSFIPEVFNEETVAAMDPGVYAALVRGVYEAAGPGADIEGVISVTPVERLYDEPSRCYTAADAALTVHLEDGTYAQTTVRLDLETLTLGDANNTTGSLTSNGYKLRMWGAERVRAGVNGAAYDGWQLTRRRWGHGVGLSQRGAQQRARMGQSYLDILAFYYVGAEEACVGTWESAPRPSSKIYSVSNEGITGVAPGTTPSDFIEKLKCEGATLGVVTSKGDEKKESELTTGNYLRLTYTNEEGFGCFFDLPIIIYGDLDGEAGIGEDDVTALCGHLSRKQLLSAPFRIAADLDRDGEVTANDLLLLIRAVCGDYKIKQG